MILVHEVNIALSMIHTLSPCAVESCPTPGDDHDFHPPILPAPGCPSKSIQSQPSRLLDTIHPSCSWPAPLS